MRELIAQEEPMGCAVACVASLLKISYKDSLRLFKIKYANSPNFYCRDIIKILKKQGLDYEYKKVTNKTKKEVNFIGSIVFVNKSKKYPEGHFLLKTKKGYMDPWINIPKINPAKAGYRKSLPEKPSWVIYKK